MNIFNKIFLESNPKIFGFESNPKLKVMFFPDDSRAAKELANDHQRIFHHRRQRDRPISGQPDRQGYVLLLVRPNPLLRA